MAATVVIERWTGSGAGTGADLAASGNTTRMKQADNGTADTNNPVPAVTTSYSFFVSTRLHCTATGGSLNLINNLKWYSDGVSAGTGLTVNAAKASTGTNAGYRYAVTAGAVALNSTNHTGLDVANPTDASTYTSGSPLSLVGQTSTAIVFGDFLIYQLAATNNASPGAMAARTYTWSYDET